MDEIKRLFINNRKWSLKMIRRDRFYFQKLSKLQKPKFLWIGCSDSRVPANEIVGLLPGELFVHRNIANLAYPNDLNCVSVLHYAVKVLKVRHIIVCGHYDCGGVRATFEGCKLGKTNAWSKDIKETMRKHERELRELGAKSEKIDRLCELSVLKQAKKISEIECVKRALKLKQPIKIHAWIYNLGDGLIKVLK